MSDSSKHAQRIPESTWLWVPVALTAAFAGVGGLVQAISPMVSGLLLLLFGLQAVALVFYLRSVKRQAGAVAGAAAAALKETQELQQREILLASVLESTPAAMVLCDDDGVVTYSNRVARDLLHGGKRFAGERLSEVLGTRAPKLQEAVGVTTDSMVALDFDSDRETFLVSSRKVSVSGQPRKLHMIRRMTGEVNRNEVETWKKLIRVLNHELNNSLAPISSLVHSARIAAKNPDKRDKLDGIFDTIAERTEHLKKFLDSYAEFARLPRPIKRDVPWGSLIERLRGIHSFELTGELPSQPGHFDPIQMEQVVINLLKNAVETGSTPEVCVARQRAGTCITVSDHGPGMSPEVLEKALLPFFSTKGSGTGLGLALSRDIVEAHGGELRLENRKGGGLAVHCWLPDRDGED